MEDEIKAMLAVIARALVDTRDDVDVEVVASGSQTCMFAVRCNKSDLGKLIGKSGRTATAIRIILTAVASKHGKRAILDIEE